MVQFTSFVLSAWVAQVASAEPSVRFSSLTTSRHLSYKSIAGYTPNSKVTDHNALDRDQKHMQAALETGGGTTTGFANARKIYTEGGNSKSYALITVADGLNSDIAKGAVIIGMNMNGEEVRGTAYDDYAKDKTVLKMTYNTSEDQATWVMCRVGGLQEDEQETTGCLNSSEKIKIDGVDYDFEYNYLTDNNNGRTLQKFSTSVDAKMISCNPGCPFADAQMYVDYYGRSDYADDWVLSAFDNKETEFTLGNADFSQLTLVGRTEAIKKGTAYMNVFMYVIREFEDAVVDCRTECDLDVCNDAPVHAWDEGVAFYTGSEEGEIGDNKSADGYFLHQLADKRCENFNTCDENGLAQVNSELLKLFKQGQTQLLANECGAAKATLKEITPLMYVPLIQGTIRYAYKVEQGALEKERAEGTVFAASILPRIHDVNATHAATIYDNMKIGASATTSFAAVKTAFEATYDEMGIDCAWVGGLADTSDPTKYVEGGQPCKASKGLFDDDDFADSDDSKGSKLGYLAAALGSIVVAFSIL